MEQSETFVGLGVRPMAQLCHKSNPEQLFISFQITLTSWKLKSVITGYLGNGMLNDLKNKSIDDKKEK